MFPVSSKKRITPLPEHVARELLAGHYHVGDKVNIDLLREGVVIGFGEKWVPRCGLNHKMAGVYINFATLHVAPDLSTLGRRFVPIDTIGRPNIEDADAWKKHLEKLRKIENIFIRIGDLPETAFWEGDTVVFSHDLLRCGHTAEPWLIESISYMSSVDNNSFSCMLSSCADGRTAQARFGGNLSLVRRGNLWKMGHGEPMEFASIEEEGLFYKSLGMSQKVMDGRYLEVPFNEGIRFLCMGGADQMKLKNKKDLTYVLIKYDNEEFGARMRRHTLSKFELGDEVIA